MADEMAVSRDVMAKTKVDQKACVTEKNQVAAMASLWESETVY
jgi:hypothetical protein